VEGEINAAEFAAGGFMDTCGYSRGSTCMD
jgi:hypothetical protein